MNEQDLFIISASRRTDIPAFYMDWFMERIRQGSFHVQNPYSKQSRQIRTGPERVHSIVFWSKDFGPLIHSEAGEELIHMGYRLYFNFTVNSESNILEPNVPPLAVRLKQLEKLVSIFGPETVSWRFDPICFFKTKQDGSRQNNLTHFPLIASKASSLGITKCVTSFFDDYAKIRRRIRKMHTVDQNFLELIDPPVEKKAAIIKKMAGNLADLGIGLHLCCEKEVFEHLDPFSPVTQNACIDGPALATLFKRPLDIKKDYGQRSKKGCQCSKSIDIGSYDAHPCPHNCIFCYAGPLMDTRQDVIPGTGKAKDRPV